MASLQGTESEILSPSQRTVKRLLKSPVVEAVLTLLVLFSLVIVVIEADSKNNPPKWMKYANIALLVMYSAEASAKLFVMRSMYFCYASNIFDILLILLDVVSEIMEATDIDAMPSFMMLRILRIFRLARAIKVMAKFPQLALLIRGLANSLSAVAYGVCFMAMSLLFWSICAVHFIHPVNQRVVLSGSYGDCLRCGRAFESVSQSGLTFVQQIIAGDSWGQVTIPIIDEEPWTAVFFGLVFISIQVTLLNVILAVIVDTALKASQEVTDELVRKKEDDFQGAAKELVAVCSSMDQDGSGDLTADELVGGFDYNEQFRNMLLAMDIKKADLQVVFSILDDDDSGTVNYDEFITELFKMKTRDSHTLLVFIKHYVTEIRRDVREQIKVLRGEFMSKIEQQGRSCSTADVRLTTLSSGTTHDAKISQDTEEAPKTAGGDAPVEEKERQPGPVLPAQEIGANFLWEELRNLRTVICEDLMQSMQEISHKSESHARLLASIAGDTSLLRGGSGHASFSKRAVPRANSLVTSSPLILPASRVQDGQGIDSSRAVFPHSPASPASTWAMRSGCCSVQKDPAHLIQSSER